MADNIVYGNPVPKFTDEVKVTYTEMNLIMEVVLKGDSNSYQQQCRLALPYW
jgi:hypothetical protein